MTEKWDVEKAALELCDCGEAGDEYDNKEGHFRWCAMFFGRKKLIEAYNAGFIAATKVNAKKEQEPHFSICRHCSSGGR